MQITNQKGQVMLITVLVLSATVLSATTIAGILTLYQLRQSVDVENSAKAIYAADSGLEWRLYKLFKDDDCSSDIVGQPTFDDIGVLFESSCVSTIDPDTNENVAKIISTGYSNKATRAFGAEWIQPSE